MKTLKYEEVYRNEYRDLAEAHAAIGVSSAAIKAGGPTQAPQGTRHACGSRPRSKNALYFFGL